MAKAVAIQNPLIEAFLNALDQRLRDISTGTPDKIATLVDSVSADVLPILAAQYDVLGYNGWKMATTDAQRREVIKGAIASWKVKGTPYSIKNTLKSVGFWTATITEHVGATYNGMLTYSGQTTYGSLDWAHFGVLVDLGNQAGVDVGLVEDLVAVINTTKNARSLLVFLDYAASLSDDVLIDEPDFDFELELELTESAAPIETCGITIYYDDGTIDPEPF